MTPIAADFARRCPFPFVLIEHATAHFQITSFIRIKRAANPNPPSRATPHAGGKAVPSVAPVSPRANNVKAKVDC
jgi:hypothetical protein